MLIRFLIAGALSMAFLNAKPVKKQMLAEARIHAAKHFGKEMSDKRIVFGKKNDFFVVTFLPRDPTAVGNGAICYFDKNGKFIRIEFMQ